ncbi:anthranilate synthase component II [Planococcus lenghuensis]|uniref:Aminodeoxychorismate/anthranilate synthase component II n=1 Tax=Planococcus lenghuensis TaxID=2213202 RepID=A0A1Q2KZ63_9BACL|nr:aminodeoxychorismate/anthranilate synthase component II [Planococcus lenghuensis]AQQ53426.1 aminodeoxychorismate/anthranilate synthase component II [Planococcus lenghuensis]
MIAIIDHYDSFTYNLVHLFEQLDPDIRVLQHDRLLPENLHSPQPKLIVLSPGPGAPADSKAARKVLDTFSGIVPILGVCLGHQAIVDYYGGRITAGKAPVHGKVSAVHHDGQGLFAGVPNPTDAVRYHSLTAEEAALPDVLQVTARSEDGVIMGVRHRTDPVWGIQFHPESILTAAGPQLLSNSVREAEDWLESKAGGGCLDANSVFAL